MRVLSLLPRVSVSSSLRAVRPLAPRASAFLNTRAFSDSHKQAEAEPATAGTPKPEEPAAAEGKADAPVAEDVEKKYQELLKSKDDEIKELKDKYLRSLAEMETVRRRAHLEVDTFKKYCNQDFAKDLLTVADNLGLALLNAQKSSEELMKGDSPEAKALKTLYDGLELTNKGLLSVFGKYSITKIESAGKKFDANLHHALFEVEDPSLEPGTIKVVVTEGYHYKDRILRVATVAPVKSS